jgi:hypothetical protein
MKQGAIAAVVCGVFNLLVMMMAMAVNAKDGPMAHFNDPWMLADVIVVFALAHFIHRQSRFAAFTMFFYYLAARIFTSLAVGRVAGLPFTLLFLFFFGRAAWASIILHRHWREAGHAPRRRWVTALLSLGAVVFLCLAGFGFMMESGFFPNTAVVRGEDLRAGVLAEMRSKNLIAEGEEVLQFYSDGVFSHFDDCSFFTQEHVVTHGEREGEEFHHSAHFKEIVAIAVDDSADIPGYTIITVTERDGEWFRLLVSAEGGGDTEFLRALRAQWRARGVGPEKRAQAHPPPTLIVNTRSAAFTSPSPSRSSPRS